MRGARPWPQGVSHLVKLSLPDILLNRSLIITCVSYISRKYLYILKFRVHSWKTVIYEVIYEILLK